MRTMVIVLIVLFCASATQAAENLNTREEWKLLPTLQDKIKMLSQYSEQECVLFWEDKIQQVLTDFEWSAEEELFLNNMVDTIKIHPEWWSKREINPQIINERKAFYFDLLEYAMYGLNWSKELIWNIFYTGEDLVHK